MNAISLCSGIGGIDIGLARIIPAYKTICYVEIEAYPQNVLLARMADGVLDRAPIWGDIRKFNGKQWNGLVDLVHGGYPCQPFSTATRGRRTAEDIWPEFHRIIEESRPQYVFLENVNPSAFRRAPLDLAYSGYATIGPAPFTASELGAPFIRRRYFLLAIAHRHGKLRQPVHAEMAELSHRSQNPWATAPGDLGMAHGSSCRMDRLKALGNGVVPGVVALAWETLIGAMRR